MVSRIKNKVDGLVDNSKARLVSKRFYVEEESNSENHFLLQGKNDRSSLHCLHGEEIASIPLD